MSLELIPFTEEEALICVCLPKRGKWFIVDQIARVVFGWDESVLRRKFKYSEMTTKNKYNVERNTEHYLLEKLKAVHVLGLAADHVYLISLQSLDLFIKSYSKRLSMFTRLYVWFCFVFFISIQDTIHRMQWGNYSGAEMDAKKKQTSKGGGGKTGATAGGFSAKASRVRTLTSADKKYVASVQSWKCAWCSDTLPAR